MAELFVSGIFLPLVIFLILSLFGRFIGRMGASFIAVYGMCMTNLIFIFFGFSTYINSVSKLVTLNSWILEGIDLCFLLDALSFQMCFLISSITFCVILYSSEYMFHDPHLIRFLSFLSLFAFFMLILVTSGNFVQMFIGWEGVGFVSFLLINFWFMRLEATRSAVKAILFNRVGDSFFLLGLVILFVICHTSDIILISNLNFVLTKESVLLFEKFEVNLDSLILILFFLAAMGKSAQLTLHAWLSDAMEGPTPVSSLLHSATMVTAGVFLLIRLSVLFYDTSVLTFVIFVGAMTACVSAIFGFFQNDLKKNIAFSTCSQLGIMTVAVVYDANIGFYHLVNHGFFKALLFLSAGSVIHALNNEQDIRKIGGLFNYLPFTRICFTIGVLALTGMPFLSGFYSKEFILFHLYTSNLFFDKVIFSFLFIASVFTVLYSMKLMKSVFFSETYKNSKFNLTYVHEPSFGMLYGMLFLSVLSILFGFFYEDLFNLIGSSFWYNIVGYSAEVFRDYLSIFFNIEISGFGWKWFFFFLLFTLLFSYTSRFTVFLNSYRKFLIDFFCTIQEYKVWLLLFWSMANKLGFISLYRKLTQTTLFMAYHVIYVLIDRGFFELIGPTFVVRLLRVQKNIIFSRNVFSFVNIFIIFLFFSVFLCLNFLCKFSVLFYLFILFMYVFYFISTK